MSPFVSVSIALVLLWFPLWVLRLRAAKLAGFDQRGWPVGRNLLLTILDVVRASAGAWSLARALPGLPRLIEFAEWQVPFGLAFAVGVGLLVQTLAWRDEDHAMAPVPYLVGVAAALVHPIVLALILPLALGSALAVRAWSAGFLAAGLGLSAVGLLVTQQDWRQAILLGAMFCTPVVVSVMAGRHLGCPRK